MVYITRQLNDEALQQIQNKFIVNVWDQQEPIPRNKLIENIKDADGLICMLTDKIDKEVLDNAPNLKVVATMSVGYDHLDLKALKERNIKVGYTPNVLTDATANLTVALLFATSRRIIEASNEARNGGWNSWSPFWMCGQGLSNSTVGIAGMGRIGFEVAKRINAFNVKQILYYNRSAKKDAEKSCPAKKVDFDRFLSNSDFIIVCLPLTPDTKHIFNAEAFSKMKSTAVFINTSRGEVVDQDALVSALKNKTIWAAGLDVMTPEPLPTNHELFKLNNCVIVPHIGSATIQARNEMAMLCVMNVISGLQQKKMPAQLKL